MGTLDGKVALITGGASGIGRGVAERLAAEGADIYVADLDEHGADQTVDLVGQHGRRGVRRKTNVADPMQLDAAVSDCVQELGRLDICVASAGIGRVGTVLEMPLEDWQQQVDINLTGVFLTVQRCARAMVKLGNGGRIVCLSSLAAEVTGARSWSYSATKAGVRIMVRGWAQELGDHGITVNAIGPGVIETPLAAGLAGDPDGAIRAGLERRTPLGRVGRPADIAGLVNFMVGPDGEFMTGSYVIMDGGLRDARAPMSDNPEVSAEAARHMEEARSRREQLEQWMNN